MLRAEGPRHTSVQQSLRYRGLQHTDFQTKWSGRPIIHSGPNRLKHAQMRRIHRSISNEKSAHSWMTPPRYRNWFVCRYLWPAASMSKRIFEHAGYNIPPKQLRLPSPARSARRRHVSPTLQPSRCPAKEPASQPNSASDDFSKPACSPCHVIISRLL